MPLLEIDLDPTVSVSKTWVFDPTGTMYHKETGMKVSTETGITFEGHEYKLSPEDIEVEDGSHLGSGAGGVVRKGIIKKTGEAVAIKTVKVDDKGKRHQMVNEIKGLVESQGCPYLVQWYAGFVSKTSNVVHIALEFMDLGSLFDLKTRLKGEGVPPVHLSCMVQQIINGLAHLHTRHLLHRDIKPHNILHNSRGEVKLTDFGIARDLDATEAVAATFVGTLTYMAPERCMGEDYSLAADVWSVGMVIYELASGQYPFEDPASFPALFEQLCEKPEPRLDVAKHPEQLCDFVALCLTRELAKRPDAVALTDHLFLTRDVGSQGDLALWLGRKKPLITSL